MGNDADIPAPGFFCGMNHANISSLDKNFGWNSASAGEACLFSSRLNHMPARYRLNEPDVSAEVFDEEVLAIDLKTGHYHSLRESGVFLWQTLMQGFSVEETASRLSARYPDSAAQALAEAENFAQQLVEAGLIVEASDATSPSDAAPAEPAGKPYVSPLIESYTDMQELLLIDPIHEVDVYTGWPQKPAS